MVCTPNSPLWELVTLGLNTPQKGFSFLQRRRLKVGESGWKDWELGSHADAGPLSEITRYEKMVGLRSCQRHLRTLVVKRAAVETGQRACDGILPPLIFPL